MKDFNKEIIKSGRERSNRPMRVGKEIKNILSDLFTKTQIKDPILFDKIIIISEVVVSPDLSHAKVYVFPWINTSYQKKEIFEEEDLARGINLLVASDLSKQQNTQEIRDKDNLLNKDNNKILLKALKNNAGFFRHVIGKNLHIKIIPLLDFVIENQFDKIEEVEAMFRNINKKT
ncbi:30S ribosome-binding factor A [Candidatus Hepatincolaceae symbiont of Richtersius coronifer]